MKKIKVIGLIISTILVVCGNITADADGDITVYHEGRLLNFDQPPVIIEDRVMIPARTLFENMGYEVEWDSGTQTATAVKGMEKIHVKVGYDNILCENALADYAPCDVPPQIVSDRVLVPLRAFSQATGCYVYWNGNNRTIYSYNWQNVTNAYKSILEQYETQRELIYDEYLYPDYYLYDIDKDGVPELIINENKSEAVKRVQIYTYNLLEKTVKHLGSSESGHSSLSSVPNDNGLMMIIAHMDYEYVKIISVEEDHVSERYIIEGKKCRYGNDVRYDEPWEIIENSKLIDHENVDNDILLYAYYL